MKKKELIIVGMSGGVDSAVSASMLIEQGYAVEALHMTNWEDDEPYCTAAQDLQDARQVCKELGIALHHVNFSREYKEKVFNKALEEFDQGLTPNPDVLCNRIIKFAEFTNYAFRLGAKKVATGHYARIENGKGKLSLLKGLDKSKDQSYFLHAINPSIMRSVLFPIGHTTKQEVREYANKKGLPNHDKPDSTGICFVGERPFKEFLKTFLPPKPGLIVSEEGKELGTHEGLMYFTIGQRKDLGIGGPGEPWYVADKDMSTNRLLVVQGRNHSRLWKQKVFVENLHWLDPDIKEVLEKKQTLGCFAKNRYRQKDAKCEIQIIAGGLEVDFNEPQWAITYGQYMVFYLGDKCLGGGKIMPKYCALD